MNTFDLWSLLITLTAVFGYLNHRFLRFPTTSGIFALALLTSILLLFFDLVFPAFQVRSTVAKWLGQIDFSKALLHGALCFLLFAGAWKVDLHSLRSNRSVIATLAFVGVILSTAVVSVLAYFIFKLLELAVPFSTCLVFAALISPTDPISVIALLKKVHASKSLETQIAGESLFNDGVGVVVFFTFLSFAGLNNSKESIQVQLNFPDVSIFFLREMGGGILLGLLCGYIAFVALRDIDEHPLELLITLATVMFTYAAAFLLEVSGPIAIVVVGIIMGNHGRRFAMSPHTADHVDAFWGMIDEILNAALFLLIALQLFAFSFSWILFCAALLMIPVVLTGRLISVSIPIALLRISHRFEKGIIPILTWSGLRGGISIAMVLSLPPFPHRNILVTCTFAVVLFSVLVQGMTMRPLLARYRPGKPVVES